MKAARRLLHSSKLAGIRKRCLAMNEEQRPLLSNLGGASPPTSRATVITVRPINNEDLPVINSGADGTAPPTTACQVCGATINLEGRMQQHVIKCSQCSEANPIKPPPLGKKYVRCPCNCLLICKQTSQRIACPRQNCNRVMQVSGDAGGTPTVEFAGGPRQQAIAATTFRARVLCVYCSEPFTAEASHMSVHEMIYVRCPQCTRRSFLNSYYRFKRMLIWYTLALLLGVAGLIVLGVLHDELDQPGAVAGWIVPFCMGGVCLAVAIYFTCLKVSEIM